MQKSFKSPNIILKQHYTNIWQFLLFAKKIENNRTIKTQFLTVLLDKGNRREIWKKKPVKFHVTISRHTKNHEDVLTAPHSTKQEIANGNGESGPMLRAQGRVPMTQSLSTHPLTANPSSESGCPQRVGSQSADLKAYLLPTLSSWREADLASLGPSISFSAQLRTLPILSFPAGCSQSPPSGHWVAV